MFSGHGAIIDDRFYLLPYGVDARTPAELKASAISASDFRDEGAELAKRGRVLVLLDACHSGAATGDGSAMTWVHYAEELEANLRDLHARVHRGAYRALASRRQYIPKADGRQRPLGIAALEDKVVQAAAVTLLTPAYEAEF